MHALTARELAEIHRALWHLEHGRPVPPACVGVLVAAATRLSAPRRGYGASMRTYRQGLTDAAELVEALWESYTDPAARAALGLAMDRLRERAAELVEDEPPPRSGADH